MSQEMRAKKSARLSEVKLAEWRALTPEQRMQRLRPSIETTCNTSIERAVAAVLDRLGVAYEAQYGISGFFADFYLPEFGLVIECDGDYWHSLPKNQTRDRRRDGCFKKLGYKVAHITETDIRADAEAIVTLVLAHYSRAS